MRASMALILANYLMDDLLNTVTLVLPHRLHFIKEYLNDLICLLLEGITDIQLIFNSYHLCIQFTIDTENN